MRQSLASWHGSHDQGIRLLRRHIHNVVDDIRREMPLREAKHFIALGGDVRFAAAQDAGRGSRRQTDGDGRAAARAVPLLRATRSARPTSSSWSEEHRLHQADAETLMPALLAYRELLIETGAESVAVPDASLRAGLLLDITAGRQPPGLRGLQPPGAGRAPRRSASKYR